MTVVTGQQIESGYIVGVTIGAGEWFIFSFKLVSDQ